MPKGTRKDNAELLRVSRENAVEMAVRGLLQRQFGNYTLDGAHGTIACKHPISINFREVAMTALAAADLFDGKPLRGSRHDG